MASYLESNQPYQRVDNGMGVIGTGLLGASVFGAGGAAVHQGINTNGFVGGKSGKGGFLNTKPQKGMGKYSLIGAAIGGVGGGIAGIFD